jgi:hypothetical protein
MRPPPPRDQAIGRCSDDRLSSAGVAPVTSSVEAGDGDPGGEDVSRLVSPGASPLAASHFMLRPGVTLACRLLDDEAC